jgi:hypothetical protein
VALHVEELLDSGEATLSAPVRIEILAGALNRDVLQLRRVLSALRFSFRGERAELIYHRVDRLLQLENLAAHFDGDLLGEVAVRDRVVTSAMLRCAPKTT